MANANTNDHLSQCMNFLPGNTKVRQLQDLLTLELPFLYRYALRIVRNSADAEDAVQEALLAAHKYIDQFRGQSQMSTWLTAIVRNCALMQLRKQTRHVHTSFDEQMVGEIHCVGERLVDRRPSPEDLCRTSELISHLRKFAMRLSPSLRRTFQLRVINGLSLSETAEILGLPQGTIKAQLARSRRKLARFMQPSFKTRSGIAQV